jgi:hypothetical protein
VNIAQKIQQNLVIPNRQYSFSIFSLSFAQPYIFFKMSQELCITGGVVASYFVLYSAYDKKSATLKPEMLTKIFGFSNLNFSLREINKVLALAGLTVFGMSFAAEPLFALGAASSTAFQEQAAGLLVAHGIYSTISFYGGDFMKKYVKNKRNMAIVMGDVALSVVAAEAFLGSSSLSQSVQDVSKETVLAASLLLGTLHFYFMEISPGPYTGTLKVRPYGFVAFGASALALGIVGKEFFAAA